MQLTAALVNTTSSRCKPELLPVTSEQSMVTSGGINCKYTIHHFRLFPLCCATAFAVSSALECCCPQSGSGRRCCCCHRSPTCYALLPCCAEWRANLGTASWPMPPALLYLFFGGTNVVDSIMRAECTTSFYAVQEYQSESCGWYCFPMTKSTVFCYEAVCWWGYFSSSSYVSTKPLG